MSTKTFVQLLRGNVAATSQKTSTQDACQALLPGSTQCKFVGFRDIALDQIAQDSAEKEKGKGRSNLWDILFPDRGIDTYRQLEGEDMTPIVVYKSGNRYYIKDGSSRLALARALGKAFILAEVWEYPC